MSIKPRYNLWFSQNKYSHSTDMKRLGVQSCSLNESLSNSSRTWVNFNLASQVMTKQQTILSSELILLRKNVLFMCTLMVKDSIKKIFLEEWHYWFYWNWLNLFPCKSHVWMNRTKWIAVSKNLPRSSEWLAKYDHGEKTLLQQVSIKFMPMLEKLNLSFVNVKITLVSKIFSWQITDTFYQNR